MTFLIKGIFYTRGFFSGHTEPKLDIGDVDVVANHLEGSVVCLLRSQKVIGQVLYVELNSNEQLTAVIAIHDEETKQLIITKEYQGLVFSMDMHMTVKGGITTYDEFTNFKIFLCDEADVNEPACVITSYHELL